jgi:uncharacterized protein
MRTVAAGLVFVLSSFPLAAAAQRAPEVTGTTAVVTGQGVVTRPADSATINVSLVSSDDVSETATSKNNAAYEALKAKLAPLGVSGDDVKTTYYNLMFNPRPADGRPATPVMQYPYPYQPRFGYVVTRQIQLVVSNVANVGKVVDAAVASGVVSLSGISYGLGDRTSANEAALAAAIENAAAQARAVAAASHMRILGVKQIQVNSAGNPMPMPGPMRYPLDAAGRPVPTQIPPATVEVRATVTVTYNLK